jgi:hypothetical protein
MYSVIFSGNDQNASEDSDQDTEFRSEIRFIQTDDLDEEELFFTVGAIEKWFLQQIDDGFMKSSQVESKKKYGEWIGKQMKAFIGVMCQKASIEDYSGKS